MPESIPFKGRHIMEKSKKRVLNAAIVGSGTDDLTNMFLSLSLASIIADLAITKAQAGLISTITNIGMLAGGLLFGYFADRYGSLKLFKITLLLFSVATAAMFFAEDLSTIYALRFIAGIGTGGEYGIAISLIARVTPVHKMGRMSSLNAVAGMVGNISAAFLASLILPRFGWNALFLLGLLPLLIVLWVHLTVSEKDLVETENAKSEKNSEIPESKPSFKELFNSPALARQTLSLMFMAVVQIGCYFGLMNWLPQIMQTSLGLSVSNSSLWMISTIIGMSIGMLFFGRILDAVGPRIAYSIFLLASASAVFLFVMAKSSIAMLVGGAIVGFFVNGMFAGYGAIVSRLYPRHIHSMANNLIINVGRAVGGFSSLIIGLLMDYSNVTTVMVFLSVCYLSSFLVMLSIEGLRKDVYAKAGLQKV